MRYNLISGGVFYLAAVVLFAIELCASEQESVSLQPAGRNFYAGKECAFRLKCETQEKRIAWQLRYSGRTIVSREQLLDKGGEAEIRFIFPELNPGVIADSELVITTGREKYLRRIFFFPANPFSGMKSLLTDREIGLWTPDSENPAQEFFIKHEIPYKGIANFADFSGATLIICGIDFSGFSGLEYEFERLCRNGARIIIINPQAGVFNIPETVESLRLADSGVINEYDKKLDAETWAGKAVCQKTIKLTNADGNPAVEIDDKPAGFSFFSAKFAGGGELIICTWRIFELANDSPAPVYLLKELILEPIEIGSLNKTKSQKEE